MTRQVQLSSGLGISVPDCPKCGGELKVLETREGVAFRCRRCNLPPNDCACLIDERPGLEAYA